VQVSAPPASLSACVDVSLNPHSAANVCAYVKQTKQVSAQQPEWASHAAFVWGDEKKETGQEQQEEQEVVEEEEEEEEGVGLASSGEAEATAVGDAEQEGRKMGSAMHGVELRQPLLLASYDQLASPFTNYVRGYVGMPTH
jgi:hypothetical protein